MIEIRENMTPIVRANQEEPMKKFWQDFKQFISRGNVMDMAVGVIVGGAFGKIVTSLVSDIIMPLIGLATGGKTITDLCIVLNGVDLYLADGTKNPAALTWNYGSFLQTIIDFLIIALCVFMMLRILMRAKKAMEEAKEGFKEGLKGKEEAAEAAPEAQADAVAAPEAAHAPAPAPDKDDQMIALLTEIKDSLKARQSAEDSSAQE